MKFKHESGLSLIYKNKDVIFILRKITFEKFKKVRKNACTLFYFKIKKKTTTLYIFSFACIWNVKKEKKREMLHNFKLLVGKKWEQMKVE